MALIWVKSHVLFIDMMLDSSSPFAQSVVMYANTANRKHK